MTLDEAINHCLERANQDCSSCADEHLQLAEWLIELKDLRKNAQVVDKQEVKNYGRYGKIWLQLLQ